MLRLLLPAVCLFGCLAVGALAAPSSSVAALPTGLPTAPAAAAVAGDPCGARVAKAGGGHWTCTLADYFSGSRLNGELWTAVTQPGNDDLCMVDDPRTVAQRSGKLQLSARATGWGLQCPLRANGTRASYAGGWVSSFYRWGQQYGRFEARIKVEAARTSGLQEAFWLWPDVRHTADTPWPASGEIDIMETYSSHPDIAIPYLHYRADDNGGPVPGLNTAWDCIAPRGRWHTYVLEWTATRLTIKVNGKTCLTNTAGASSFRKPFIINFTQFLGGAQNVYDGRVPLPATMEIDYVKAWK